MKTHLDPRLMNSGPAVDFTPHSCPCPLICSPRSGSMPGCSSRVLCCREKRCVRKILDWLNIIAWLDSQGGWGFPESSLGTRFCATDLVSLIAAVCDDAKVQCEEGNDEKNLVAGRVYSMFSPGDQTKMWSLRPGVVESATAFAMTPSRKMSRRGSDGAKVDSLGAWCL